MVETEPVNPARRQPPASPAPFIEHHDGTTVIHQPSRRLQARHASANDSNIIRFPHAPDLAAFSPTRNPAACAKT
jgi:hypothetical protein